MIISSIRTILGTIGKRFTVLREMFRNLVSRPVTIRYPDERYPVPEGFRGRVAITDENCIGCGKCSRVCPANAITMVEGPREIEVNGKKIMRKNKPQVAVYDCIRCGLCERHCPMKGKAIHLTPELSTGATDKDAVVVGGEK